MPGPVSGRLTVNFKIPSKKKNALNSSSLLNNLTAKQLGTLWNIVSPHDYLADLELYLAASAQHLASMVLNIAGLGKGPNSKCEVRFLRNLYCFCTIVKLNHLNSQPSVYVCINKGLRIYLTQIYVFIYLIIELQR